MKDLLPAISLTGFMKAMEYIVESATKQDEKDKIYDLKQIELKKNYDLEYKKLEVMDKAINGHTQLLIAKIMKESHETSQMYSIIKELIGKIEHVDNETCNQIANLIKIFIEQQEKLSSNEDNYNLLDIYKPFK